MSPLDYYPWQYEVAHDWLQHTERFAHAWLIHGAPGIGKVQFAKAGAAALLCEQPQAGQACGQCTSCHWVRTGNHPDLRWLRPESYQAQEDPDSVNTKTPSKHIRIEQLRALADWFHTATHRGGFRVIVLYPAESLNHVSANALLKILEEPIEKTVFLLVSHNYQSLLPTIISRCRRLHLSVPAAAQSIDWLQSQQVSQPSEWLAAVGGAPVAALKASQQYEAPYPTWLAQLVQYLLQQPKAIIALADQLEAEPAAVWLEVLQRLYVDLQLTSLGLSPRYYLGLAKSYATLAPQLSELRLQQQWKWLAAQKKQAEHPLNAKLLIHTALERVVQSCTLS